MVGLSRIMHAEPRRVADAFVKQGDSDADDDGDIAARKT